MFFLHLERDGEFTGQSPLFLRPVDDLVLTPLNVGGGGIEGQSEHWSVSWEQ